MAWTVDRLEHPQDESTPTPRSIAPGKRALTDRLQLRRAPAARAAEAMPGDPPTTSADPFWFATDGDRSPDALAHAASGIAGPGSSLPHGDTIQRAFGHHDVGHVRAHVGGAAATAADALGAVAFATGADVAFAAPPDLHTAAHEAAHVIQQREGVSRLAVGLGAADDPAEAHADRVADAVVAGHSAEALLDAFTGGGASAGPIVQRKITASGAAYPSTFKQIATKLPAGKAAATAAFEAAATRIGAGVDRERLERVWNKVAKADDATFDLPSQEAALVDALVARYARSAKASHGARGRADEASGLSAGLHAARPSLEFKSSARNPMVVDDDLEEVDFDLDDTTPQGRFATHLSTVVLAAHPLGQEVQAAPSLAGTSVSVSTNLNGTNQEVAGRLKVAADIKELVAEVLEQRGAWAMSAEQAMDDVVVRHALKVYRDITKVLAPDAVVDVPQAVAIDLDGTHAEIRIEQSGKWSQATHAPPSGTKYPCMGCFLYFQSKKIEIGHWYGPLWVTNAALSQQLRDQLLARKRIGTLGAGPVASVSASLATSYGALPASAKMGKGKTRDGDATFARKADSDSDLDDDDIADLMGRAKARHDGKPMSPLWQWPPDAGSASASSSSSSGSGSGSMGSLSAAPSSASGSGSGSMGSLSTSSGSGSGSIGSLSTSSGSGSGSMGVGGPMPPMPPWQPIMTVDPAFPGLPMPARVADLPSSTLVSSFGGPSPAPAKAGSQPPPPASPWASSPFGNSGASWMMSAVRPPPARVEDLEPHRVIRYLRWRDSGTFPLFLAEGGFLETSTGIIHSATGAPADPAAVAAHLVATASMDLAELLRVEAKHFS